MRHTMLARQDVKASYNQGLSVAATATEEEKKTQFLLFTMR